VRVNFTKTFLTGSELSNIEKALCSGELQGGGSFTKKSEAFIENRYNCKKVLLTPSCTAALEFAALLLDIGPGDEVIVPSFTFVTSASAFALRGAKVIFCDSKKDHPNLDVQHLQTLISEKTKVIVPVHYGGVPCEMDLIMEIASENNIFVVEDAAQAIESSFCGKQLGTIGDIGVFSFHDTKNISSGEGGAILINNESLIGRSEIIREKGTNRSSYFRGEVNKYEWVDLGSSFLMSEVSAAFLFSQLLEVENITNRRRKLWHNYESKLSLSDEQGVISHCSRYDGNGHLYSLFFQSEELRNRFIDRAKEFDINVTFHFLPLDDSHYIRENFSLNSIGKCINSQKHSKTIARLPMYTGMTEQEQDYVIQSVAKILKELMSI